MLLGRPDVLIGVGERSPNSLPWEGLLAIELFAHPAKTTTSQCSSLSGFEAAIDTEDCFKLCSRWLATEAELDSGARDVPVDSDAVEAVLLASSWTKHSLHFNVAVDSSNGSKLCSEGLELKSERGLPANPCAVETCASYASTLLVVVRI